MTIRNVFLFENFKKIRRTFCPVNSRNKNKYLAICFKVFAYCDPQMNADGGFICVHPRFVKAVFPEKNPGKLLARYLL